LANLAINNEYRPLIVQQEGTISRLIARKYRLSQR
jgi:hypothetical protein